MKNFQIVSIFICVLSCFTLQAWAQNFPNLNSCSLETRTRCKYYRLRPVDAAVNYKSLGLTSAQEDAVLAKHNEYRRWVASGQEQRGKPGPQPAATNMEPLVWDPQLAVIAQQRANQCFFKRGTSKNVDEYSVGENMGSFLTTGPYDKNFEKIVTNWYDEVEDFDRKDVPKLTNENITITGHYTQMVWADTKKVGCGLIEFHSGIRDTSYLVCIYWPSGNCIGQPVYKTS